MLLALAVAGVAARTRRFVAPIYVVALGTALYTLAFFPQHDAWFQTEILLTFAAAAFSAGLRERQVAFGSVVTGFFGLLAPRPLALGDADGLHISLLALGLTVAALAVRRVWGRPLAIAPYLIALWAVVDPAVALWIAGGVLALAAWMTALAGRSMARRDR